MTDPNGPQSALEQHRRKREKQGRLDPEQKWVATHDKKLLTFPRPLGLEREGWDIPPEAA
jgi:hypothetical protein